MKKAALLIAHTLTIPFLSVHKSESNSGVKCQKKSMNRFSSQATEPQVSFLSPPFPPKAAAGLNCPLSHVALPSNQGGRATQNTHGRTACKHGLCPVSINPLSRPYHLYPNCTQKAISRSRDAEVMTVLVAGSMGNLCLHTVPVYEARTVAELASRVVEKQGKEPKVGDLEKLLGSSCASRFQSLRPSTKTKL